ncbi:DUF1127 domain-containing protein [Shimia sp.]|uniref:DUF1127 domain-containing protein n=1 Tax=Shimia sp. TaxID=1954381 RepID=UPI003B8DA5DD
MAHVNATYSTGFDFTARVLAAIESFKEARALRQQYNTTVRELASMSNRELADVGISRYDIKDIAEAHVYG